MHKDLCIRSWSSNWFRQLIACLLMIYRNPELVASLCKIGWSVCRGLWNDTALLFFNQSRWNLHCCFENIMGFDNVRMKNSSEQDNICVFFSLELANSSLKIALLTLASRCKKVIHVEFKLKIMIYISNIHIYLDLKLCFI